MSGKEGPDQEFVVRIPTRNARKTHHVMKFNGSLKIDLTQWSQGSVRMVRENNQKNKQIEEEEAPKFGAGSEFGREQREEARRKKFGIKSKKYNPHAQPWLIRVGDKRTGKRYRGIREGGVSDNTSYYVFTHAQDGSFEAHPIKEWYNFTPIQTYKTLNAEEAEEQFAHRGKILNHWALMVNKKLKPDADNSTLDDEDDSKKKGKNAKKDSSFKISDMDDWIESGDELDSDSDTDAKKKKKDSDDDEGDPKKKGKDSKKKKKKTKHDVDNEAFEDSDDGDDECREVDYMSDESSDSENELNEKLDTKGVDQDRGLSKMLDSESSSDDDEDEKKKDSDSDHSDPEKKKKKKDKKKNSGKRSGSNSRANTPEPNKADKRKALVDNVMDLNEPAAKKSRLEQFGTTAVSTPLSSNETLLEEDVRRYLTRKPMTTTELVKKINSKKFNDLPKEELMPLLVNVLKKVNPIKTKTKGIMYLSLKK